MYLAYDIEWDIDVEDALEVLKEYSTKDIASILCIPNDIADILTIKQIEELVRKNYRKTKICSGNALTFLIR